MNWQKAFSDLKTTIPALLSSFASFVLFTAMIYPDWIKWPGWVIGLAMFAFVGGLAQFGIQAKSVAADALPKLPDAKIDAALKRIEPKP